MALLMLSAGMFSALAATIAPRRRGLESGSPPPFFAAILISLMRRVKILPRLASSAPFLCLIVAHFEWPDMARPRILGSMILDGAGFARRGDHRIASVQVKANRNYSTGYKTSSNLGPTSPEA